MRELIVYLEPALETVLQKCLDHFLNEIAPNYYPSTAVKYPPHVSVTGFFKVNGQAGVDSIIAAYSQAVESINQDSSGSPTIDLTPILVPIHPSQRVSRHLLLPVTVSTRFHSLLTQCANQKAFIRPKRMDHISLAYWDEPQATDMETDAWLAWCNGPHMEQMKQDLTERLMAIKDDTRWSMVLYERTHLGLAIGEKHRFNELCRWLIS